MAKIRAKMRSPCLPDTWLCSAPGAKLRQSSIPAPVFAYPNPKTASAKRARLAKRGKPLSLKRAATDAHLRKISVTAQGVQPSLWPFGLAKGLGVLSRSAADYDALARRLDDLLHDYDQRHVRKPR
jgi:hypothetical protein